MLKLDSPYFDPVRVQPKRRRRKSHKLCAHPGCNEEAPHPAPVGRDRGHIWLCAQHIGPYNKAYDFFAGMSEREICAWQTAALWGHRPLQSHPGAHPGGVPRWRTEDVFNLFGYSPSGARIRAVPEIEVKACAVLGVAPDADCKQIKFAFKALVKRYHPDHNGGGGGGGEAAKKKLVRIIEAYHFLEVRRAEAGAKNKVRARR